MNPGRLYNLYLDESRQTQDRFMVFGGILVPDEIDAKLLAKIGEWREENRMHAELKWTKVSDAKLAEYKSLTDFFFLIAERKYFVFQSIVIDTSQIDYRTFHQGNKELGFYKFFYQFILHSFGRKFLSEDDRLRIYFDSRSSKQKLGTFKVILNRGLRKKQGWGKDVVRNVEAVDSKKFDFIQVADVLMGAIGFQNNDCHLRPNAKKAKIELANYIAGRAKILSLKENTPYRMAHFGIWQFRFSKKKRAP